MTDERDDLVSPDLTEAGAVHDRTHEGNGCRAAAFDRVKHVFNAFAGGDGVLHRKDDVFRLRTPTIKLHPRTAVDVALVLGGVRRNAVEMPRDVVRQGDGAHAGPGRHTDERYRSHFCKQHAPQIRRGHVKESRIFADHASIEKAAAVFASVQNRMWAKRVFIVDPKGTTTISSLHPFFPNRIHFVAFL